MADLYLERIGLINPTIVERDNNGKIERLESRGLDMASLVAFWRRCFDLNGPLFEKIILHCKSKDFNAMGGRAMASCRSVRELLAEQGVECVVDDEWFKDHEVKNELFEQNMKNVLEIEKKNAVKEFMEKLKVAISMEMTVVRDCTDEKSVLRRRVDVDVLLKKIEELLKEFENDN